MDGDTIRIQDYITQGASNCSGVGGHGAGTLAHEFGHALGLPDYCHWIARNAGAEGRRWVLGCWELMAAGSWGCGPTTTPTGTFGPTHFSAPVKPSSAGSITWAWFSATGAATWTPTTENLAVFFTRGPRDPAAPTPAMADYLDRTGNDNGACDVGDLRKWLRTRAP